MTNEETTIAKREESSLVAPSELRDKYGTDNRGTDHLTKDDVKMPRLSLAQKMSPQLEKSDPKYIESLEFGELFNDLEGTNYGTGPLHFTVVRADRPRGIEFNPIEDGGGVRDFNVPLNDARMSFGPNGEKPIATLFYDYILMLLPSQELIALSLKSSALKVARQLNGFMKMRGMPSFTGKYGLTTETVTNNKGQAYAVYIIKNAGWVDAKTAELAESIFEDLRDRDLNIVHDEENRDSSSNVAEGEVVDEGVPF